MELAANALCLLAPWLSPWECRPGGGGGDDDDVDAWSEGGGNHEGSSHDVDMVTAAPEQQDSHQKSASIFAEGAFAAEAADLAGTAAGIAEAVAGGLSEQEDGVTERTMQNLTAVTTALLQSIRSASLPRSYQEWAALFASLGAAAKDYGSIVGRFVLKADVWHACLVVVVLLAVTAKLWTKFVSELLENLFR